MRIGKLFPTCPLGVAIVLLCLTLAPRAGQPPLVELTIDPVIQKDAPVQVVAIKATGANVLAPVTVKNMTDKYVQDLTITWSMFRPVNCAVSGPAPPIEPASPNRRRWFPNDGKRAGAHSAVGSTVADDLEQAFGGFKECKWHRPRRAIGSTIYSSASRGGC
jgi:hypothetical protein